MLYMVGTASLQQLSRTILAESAANGLTIPLAPPLSIHRFLNARNATAQQADFALTYLGNNIFLQTLSIRTFFKATFLQFLTLTRQQACPRSSPLLPKWDRRTCSRKL